MKTTPKTSTVRSAPPEINALWISGMSRLPVPP